VAGFIGEQYALPEAVDALRRVRRTERAGEAVRIRASDPLNLVGILTPGPRIPANHAPWLVFVDGMFVTPGTPGAPEEESGEAPVSERTHASVAGAA
jgi:ATP-dependent Lhr-like helicase